MKLARSSNTIRNIRAGALNKVIEVLGPFIVRTVFIYTLGAEYLGLNSLFTSVLNVLSLTELGFGSAVIFSMYKAIAAEDSKTINALLYYYRKVYRYVGCIIFAIGLLIIPILPYLVKGSYPADVQPVFVYLIFLFNSSISYFLFAYLGSLISAFQRTDLGSLIGACKGIFTCIAQIILLLKVKNYYVYILVLPVSTILNNISIAIVAKKVFPQYKPFGKLSPIVKASIKEKVSGLVIQNVCAVSRNAFDSVFVSSFLGLTSTAIYNNYYLIMTSIIGFMTIITSSVLAGVGNSVATESKEKNHQDMFRMNFPYMWIAGWCTTCLLCLYQQFMEIWVGKDMLLPMSSVILFCIYFYVLKMGDIRCVYSDANGLWWQNRFRAVMEAVTNIVLNYILGKRFGINGIITATLISLFIINFCYGSQLVYKYYYTEQRVGTYFVFHARCAAVTALVSVITYLICNCMPYTLTFFLVRAIVCIIVPNTLYFAIYRNTKIYNESIPWLRARIIIKRSA